MTLDRLAEIKRRHAPIWPSVRGDVDWLIAEVERLAHLHQLDHSLADQWQAKNEHLRQLLARLEWAGVYDYEGDSCCPACGRWPVLHDGDHVHTPDCWLAAALNRPDPEPSP